VRLPGALDGFEVALCAVLGGGQEVERVVQALGEPLEAGLRFRFPGLTHFAPTAPRIAAAGARSIAALGVPPRRAECLVALARAMESGALRLAPGCDVAATRSALLEIDGIDERHAAMMVSRALSWPDAFPPADAALVARAEQWRPWRAYAAVHLTYFARVSVPSATSVMGPPATDISHFHV
jgi:AraC family transcriptional regulator, regulatory protein of adaptative response / DNA-3-methyladenine glycosylase II